MTDCRVIYLKEGCTEPKVKVIDDDLQNLKKLIGCDTIDIPRKYINNRPFRIICDDCGLL